MFNYRLLTQSPSATLALARSIAAQLRPGDVLAMTGNLAAGKTTFTQGISEYFKVGEYALSPTFTYINEYHGESQDIIHVDAYRLNTGEDLISMGIWDYYESGAIVIIEWADIVATAIPLDAFGLTFRHAANADDHREILLSAPREMEISSDYLL